MPQTTLKHGSFLLGFAAGEMYVGFSFFENALFLFYQMSVIYKRAVLGKSALYLTLAKCTVLKASNVLGHGAYWECTTNRLINCPGIQ